MKGTKYDNMYPGSQCHDRPNIGLRAEFPCSHGVKAPESPPTRVATGASATRSLITGAASWQDASTAEDRREGASEACMPGPFGLSRLQATACLWHRPRGLVQADSCRAGIPGRDGDAEAQCAALTRRRSNLIIRRPFLTGQEERHRGIGAAEGRDSCFDRRW